METRDTNPVALPHRMETLSEALARFEAAGYSESFQATADGLRAYPSGVLCRFEDLETDEVARFEGTSDPADEATALALSCGTCGIRGTYVVTFGPVMPPEEGEAIRALLLAARGRARAAAGPGGKPR